MCDWGWSLLMWMYVSDSKSKKSIGCCRKAPCVHPPPLCRCARALHHPVDWIQAVLWGHRVCINVLLYPRYAHLLHLFYTCRAHCNTLNPQHCNQSDSEDWNHVLIHSTGSYKCETLTTTVTKVLLSECLPFQMLGHQRGLSLLVDHQGTNCCVYSCKCSHCVEMMHPADYSLTQTTCFVCFLFRAGFWKHVLIIFNHIVAMTSRKPMVVKPYLSQ